MQPHDLERCPMCAVTLSGAEATCPGCGLVFAKYLARQRGEAIPARDTVSPRARPTGLDAGARRSLVIGVAAGGALWASGFLDFAFMALATLVHEIGHAAVSWALGSPALPAFDFRYGGGVTITFDQKTPIVVFTYACLLALAWGWRRNRSTLAALAGITATYALLAHTRLGEALMLFMGHGAEIAFAGVALYRGISGFAITHAVQRPMYATIGVYLLLHDLSFSFQLMTSRIFRLEYAHQKGGFHEGDFDRLADAHFGVPVGAVALVFLLCTLATPFVTFALWRYREHWIATWHRLREKGSEPLNRV